MKRSAYPVGPVTPVAPVVPVEPSTPFKFTLKTWLVNVP